MEWPKVQVTSTKSQTQYKFLGGGWVPMLMSYLMLTAIFLPYIVVLCRDTLNPFLPFVSQAAGSPPQSGIFAIFLALSSIVAFIGLNVLHMGLRIHKSRTEDHSIRQTLAFLNKAILIPGHIAILGMLIVAAYPLDFYRHNEEWMIVTIIPHLIGATSLFLGGIIFCILYTHIMSILNPDKKGLLLARFLLIGLVVFTAALHGYTVRDGFMEEYEDENRLTSCVMLRYNYNLSYIVCSISEWVLVVGFVAFFTTIREEAKSFCFTMTVTLDGDLTPAPKKDVNHNSDRKSEGAEEKS